MKNHLIKFQSLLFVLFFLLIIPNLAYSKNNFSIFLDEVASEALSLGISKKVINDFKKSSVFIPKVIKYDKSQPEFKLTLDQYLKRVVTPLKIKNANKKYKENKEILIKVGEFYGVQPRFIVALWGIETDFGRLTGGFPVISSLSTLAFEGRRHDYFKKELLNALKIIDKGHISLKKMTGSWAGAMGQCQFMPSSFLNYASDWDKNGTKDIWNSKGDVFASAANYLKKVGWSNKTTWGRKVNISNYKIKHKKNKILYLDDWSNLGVLKNNKNKLPSNKLKARLIIPDNYGQYGYLVYNNFENLLNWNRSNYFAIAVGKLSDNIKEN
ncbi:MAG: lytic murein transglycosylase [Candidatus Puniceispirillales bacterium]|jgi:membrane-bound lytic murein transglycosylase B|tara:strand:- start:721 stop:1698 length:978 start_codon:yes stop_codon:yes gene_type:complete